MRIEPVTPKRAAWLVLLSFAAAVVILMITPLIGSAEVGYSRAFAGIDPDRQILFDLRLPRVLLAGLAGGALATAGVLFQALLRDALATPYTLGISSGASLGAVLAICFGWVNMYGSSAVWLAACAGAACTLFVVLGVASKSRRMSPFTLLMAGITLNSITMAIILFLHNLSSVGESFQIVRWLMGGIDSLEYRTLAWLAAIILPVTFYIFVKSREWNLIAIGEQWTAVRGASPSRLLLTGYILGSVLTGCITALTGPIGFVGLIVPHAIRMRVGADHRVLIPCSFFIGGAFLAICDTIARTVLAPAEIPVSVITAVLGGTFFIWLLRTKVMTY